MIRKGVGTESIEKMDAGSMGALMERRVPPARQNSGRQGTNFTMLLLHNYNLKLNPKDYE